MKKVIVLFILGTFVNSSVFCQNQTIVDNWNGKLVSSFGEIEITLNITASPLSGKLSSSSGIQGIELEDLVFEEGRFHFSVPSVGAKYEGKMINDNEIKGTWSQGANVAELNFSRLKETNAHVSPLRKQTPTKPFGYRAEEVSFVQPNNKITLSGTLTIPEGEGPFPAVILLSVAGANDRDQTHSHGHKPFLVLADYLTNQGIAVLRYDDRGIGGSEGDLFESDFSDLTKDALAAFQYLISREEIDPKKTGFIGHSEGTVIGAMASVKEPQIAFTIMLGAVGVPLSELGKDRLDKMQALYQLNEEEKAEIIRYLNELHGIIAMNLPEDAAKLQIENLKAENTFDKPNFPNYLFFLPSTKEKRVELFLTPWYRAQVTYQPNEILTKLTCPTLVINGTLDVFQSPELNFPAIFKALSDAGNEDFTIVVVPKINHVMQTAETGFPTEYARLEESFSPNILKMIGNWIKLRF